MRTYFDMNEDEAFALLFNTILTENGYYDNTRAWARKHSTVEDVADRLSVLYLRDSRGDYLSPYKFLDAVEDAIASDNQYENCNDIDKIVEELDFC